MRIAKIAFVAAALVAVATPLAAQIRMQVTPFYGNVLPQGNLPTSFAVTKLDGTTVDIKDGKFEKRTPVYGGMVGLQVLKYVSLEGTILTGKDKLTATRLAPTDVNVLAYSGGISIDLPKQWRFAPFLVGGAGVKSYDFKIADAQTRSDYEYNAGVGVNLELSKNFALNVQARDLYSTFNSALYGVKDETQNDVFVAAGFSIKFGLGTPSGVAALRK